MATSKSRQTGLPRVWLTPHRTRWAQVAAGPATTSAEPRAATGGDRAASSIAGWVRDA